MADDWLVIMDHWWNYTDRKTEVQGGSNMTGTDFCVNKLHCAAAVRP